jgi:hypothetical protein
MERNIFVIVVVVFGVNVKSEDLFNELSHIQCSLSKETFVLIK